MIFAPFSLTDAELILRESEGRGNAGGRGSGHAGERHVKIVNGHLMHRMTFGDATDAGMPIYTAFCTFADQVRAFHEALASDELAREINAFYRKGKPLAETFRCKDAIQIRVATGGGVITRWDHYISFTAERQKRAYREMHLITLFPHFAPGSLGKAGRPG